MRDGCDACGDIEKGRLASMVGQLRIGAQKYERMRALLVGLLQPFICAFAFSKCEPSFADLIGRYVVVRAQQLLQRPRCFLAFTTAGLKARVTRR
jgi:hypothetical protein